MDSLPDKVLALEFRKTYASGQLWAMSYQIHSLLHHNLSSVRVLSQERHGASLKVARDPPSVNQKNTTFWIFESGFIKNLPWDPREWHWKEIYPLGDVPFFGYTCQKGLQKRQGALSLTWNHQVHQRPRPQELYHLSGGCQDLAQRPS